MGRCAWFEEKQFFGWGVLSVQLQGFQASAFTKSLPGVKSLAAHRHIFSVNALPPGRGWFLCKIDGHGTPQDVDGLNPGQTHFVHVGFHPLLSRIMLQGF